MNDYDVVVIGGGPAGLAAALSSKEHGARTLIIEREGRLGGILKQCIHDGFGLIHFGQKLSGPEYAERYVEKVEQAQIDRMVWSFVTAIASEAKGFCVTLVNREGMIDIHCKSLILATGCRERTAKQVFIHGTRPAGVFTAGSAQHFTNILGQLPTKKCVILGSGDIGLIMARRLTLEGAEVLGVFEAKTTPSGLTRNLVQCLDDFNIPLHLSHTVTKVYGYDRLTGVEISQVDQHMKPIPGTAYDLDCDGLILSVGLIPENEVAGLLGVTIDSKTKGPKCDTNFMTDVPGVFSCGNALHVNDLVDYVSESGELAGAAAARYGKGELEIGETVDFQLGSNIAYFVPQVCSIARGKGKEVFYFRTKEEHKKGVFQFTIDDKIVFEKQLTNLKPPEMIRLETNLDVEQITANSKFRCDLMVNKV